jgi:peptidoglycan/LPS O-acetylase OafA/YrhL
MDAERNLRNASSDTNWMNGLRALAVIGVVIHHWLSAIPFEKNVGGFSALAQFVCEVCGTGVQLFFVLSGCGLAISYMKRKEHFLLGKWALRRFQKIVLPYWIIVACTFGLANLASFEFGDQVASYGWPTLLAYLSFTRNHYEPGWSMNVSMWFMPVIIGLYVFFPILMRFLKKFGMGWLLILTAIITYGSINLLEYEGYKIGHQNAIFLFFLLDFAMGMVIGYMRSTRADSFARLIGAKSFFLGLGFYGLSFAIIEIWEHGDLYNDTLTGLGLFLMGISMWDFAWQKLSDSMNSIADEVSRVSYLMYLIHVPLILYIIRPVLERTTRLPFNPVISLGLSGVFAFMVFIVARLIYRPVMAIAKTG